jgi:hypothetical protein
MHRPIALGTAGCVSFMISEQVPENPGQQQPDTMADKGDTPK